MASEDIPTLRTLQERAIYLEWLAATHLRLHLHRMRLDPDIIEPTIQNAFEKMLSIAKDQREQIDAFLER